MVKANSMHEGGCELGVLAQSPILQPVLLPRCVQSINRPVFTHREIIYT